MVQNNKKRLTPKFIASVGVLAGISVVLMLYLEFPIPFMPTFLKFDFSAMPALVGGFAYGPLVGVLIVFIKALVHVICTSTGVVGELADFLASGALVLVSALIYSRFRTKKGAVTSLLFGILAMTVVGALANYFILIPLYSQIMPIEKIIDMCAAVNPLIKDKLTYVLYGAVPFNIIKGLILSLVTFLVYKHISRILR